MVPTFPEVSLAICVFVSFGFVILKFGNLFEASDLMFGLRYR